MLEIWTKRGDPLQKLIYKINNLQKKGGSNFKYSVSQCDSYSLKGVLLHFLENIIPYKIRKPGIIVGKAMKNLCVKHSTKVEHPLNFVTDNVVVTTLRGQPLAILLKANVTNKAPGNPLGKYVTSNVAAMEIL